MAQLYPFTDPIAVETDPPRSIAAGDGCYVTDTAGNRFFDAVAGLWCASLGFNPPRLAEAAQAQMKKLAYYHSFLGRTTAISDELAAALLRRLPRGMAHVMFGLGGSEAVDTAVKLMRYYQIARGKPGKMRVIARNGAYHGSGTMSAALTGFDYCHDGFSLPSEAVLRTGRPHFYGDADPGETEIAFAKRRARELDTLIRAEDPGTIGAFIGEPAMGAGGVILPPEGYWAEVQEVLARHDIALIADETITGFGRTGTWFGCQTYGISADMMTMAKQLSAAVFPISAVAMTKEMHATIASQAHDFGVLGHGFTYGGHPVGAAVALATLRLYDEMDLPEHVLSMGKRIAPRLVDISTLDAVGEVRLQGLLGGVELRSDTVHGDMLGRRVIEAAERRGVFFRAIGNVVAISPPYIATEAELDHMMDVLEASIVDASAP